MGGVCGYVKLEISSMRRAYFLSSLDANLKGLTPFTTPIRIPGAVEGRMRPISRGMEPSPRSGEMILIECESTMGSC